MRGTACPGGARPGGGRGNGGERHRHRPRPRRGGPAARCNRRAPGGRGAPAGGRRGDRARRAAGARARRPDPPGRRGGRPRAQLGPGHRRLRPGTRTGAAVADGGRHTGRRRRADRIPAGRPAPRGPAPAGRRCNGAGGGAGHRGVLPFPARPPRRPARRTGAAHRRHRRLPRGAGRWAGVRAGRPAAAATGRGAGAGGRPRVRPARRADPLPPCNGQGPGAAAMARHRRGRCNGHGPDRRRAAPARRLAGRGRGGGGRLLVHVLWVAGFSLVVAAVYVVIVLGLGKGPADAGDREILGLSMLAAAVAAAVYLPSRDRLLASATRFVYGAREAPDEVLGTFGSRMTRAVAMDELLLQLAESLRKTMGLTRAEVYTGGEVLERAVSVPDAGQRSILVSKRERPVVTRAGVSGNAWA